MFNSISKATPTTTVTSSFVADETCAIVFGVAPLAVRINGTASTSSPYSLNSGDKIEVDYTSPAAKGYAFFSYTYNGTNCAFAIVSNSGTTRPTLRSQYRNQWIGDTAYTVGSTNTYMMDSSGSTQSVIFVTYLNGISQDQVVYINPSNGVVSFINAGGGRVGSQVQNAGDPYVAYAWLYNGSTAANEIYLLTKAGWIHKYTTSETKTVSAFQVSGATSIFSDGISLWILGPNILYSTDSSLAAGLSYPNTYNFFSGCSVGGTNFITTRDGKLIKQVGSTFSVLRSSTMVGEPCVYQNQVVVPFPEEYLLVFYDNNGNVVQNIDTGDYLPFACNADNANMAVACMNTKDVLWFTGTTPSIKSFPTKITYAVPNDGNLLGADFLNSYETTAPPDPAINGITWPVQNPPVNVNTGSGDTVMTTLGDAQRVVTPDGTIATVNGTRRATSMISGQKIQVKTRSALGKKSVPVIIGSYAFDYLVVGRATTAFSSQIDVPNQIFSASPTFTITVPDVVINAPVAVSYGNLKINGTAYDGSKLVNAGDTLVINFDAPTPYMPFASVLTIADSQYGLTVNSAAVQDTDLENFVDYSIGTVQSTFQVTETGSYHLPDYTNASATVNGNPVTFPTTMNANDTVVMTHVITSSYRYDERFTILMGPNINYKLTSRTMVHDVPAPMDFGTVHLGIPDFASIPDGSGTISGLSPNWYSDLQTPYLQFSVNGGPYMDKGHVTNGDVVTISYTVQNLWDGTRPVQVFSLATNGLVDCGIFHIDPALGDYMEVRNNQVEGVQDTIWAKYQPRIQLEDAPIVSNDIDAPVRQMTMNAGSAVQGADHYYQLNTGTFVQAADHYYQVNVGSFIQPADHYYQLNTGSIVQAADHYYQLNTGVANQITLKTPSSSIPAFDSNATVFTQDSLPEFFSDAANTAFITISADLGAEFDLLSTYTSFTPFWYVQQNYTPVYFPGYFIYQAGNDIQHYGPGWLNMQDKPPRWVNPAYLYYYANPPRWQTTSWNTISDKPPRWVKIIGSRGPMRTELFVSPVYDRQEQDIRIVNLNGIFVPENDQQTLKYSLLTPTYVGKLSRSTDHSAKFVSEVLNVAFTAPLISNFAQGVLRSNLIQANFNHGAITATAALNAFKPVKPSAGAAPVAASAVNDGHWVTNVQPTQVGGYATQQDAETAAAVYTNTLEVDTYQQPEGSFSFTIKRDTTLTCPIVNTGLVATKWLLGGG